MSGRSLLLPDNSILPSHTADQQQALQYKMPSSAPYSLDKINQIQQQPLNTGLTADEKTAVSQWLADYNSWKEQNDKFDPIVAQRQRDASFNLAMILVGLPLYFFHWRIIKREAKQQEEAANA